MELQGRKLTPRMSGDDVALLQRELAALGYVIPEGETRRKFYGAATRAVVMKFQESCRIAATGTVDEETAARINAEVDRIETRPDPEAENFIVHEETKGVGNHHLTCERRRTIEGA